MISNIIATIGLFFGIAYGYTCTGRVMKGLHVNSGQVFLMALGWTMLIAAKLIF